MPNFGEKLRAARAAKQLTPQQIEFDTRIRAVVISALEEEEFGNLPPEPYTRGLLRNYARYLGLDAEELLEEYTSAVSAKKPPPPSSASKGCRIHGSSVKTVKSSGTGPALFLPIRW